MNLIYDSHLDNEMGRVHCMLASNHNYYHDISICDKSTVIRTQSHICELINIKLKDEWLPKGMYVEESHGWLWKIKRTSSDNEQLYLKCFLEPNCEVLSQPDTGECLDAIEIENDLKVMHIGTEDPEVLYYRAKISDLMPSRLLKEFSNEQYYLGYTEYMENGFRTRVPDLIRNEVVYFQYLYALNTIKKSEMYPNENDISTWYAVDKDKSFLAKELSLKFTI